MVGFKIFTSFEQTVVRNKQKLEQFYRRLKLQEKFSYKKSVRIYDALHKETVALGAISHGNI